MMLDVYRIEKGRAYSTDHYPEINSQLFTERCDELRESFLDDVFGLES